MTVKAPIVLAALGDLRAGEGEQAAKLLRELGDLTRSRLLCVDKRLRSRENAAAAAAVTRSG